MLSLLLRAKKRLFLKYNAIPETIETIEKKLLMVSKKLLFFKPAFDVISFYFV